MDEKKVSSLRAVEIGETSKMAGAVATLRREQDLIFQYNREMAKIIRNEYLMYVEAGFRPAQAMKLVTAKITPPAK